MTKPPHQSPDDKDNAPSIGDVMRSEFDAGHDGIITRPLFLPDEIDIFVNKQLNDCYFFHGKEVDYNVISHVEFNRESYAMTMHLKDGTIQDLGIKLQWLVRPYFAKADKVYIAQTDKGEIVTSTHVPLVVTEKA